MAPQALGHPEALDDWPAEPCDLMPFCVDTVLLAGALVSP